MIHMGQLLRIAHDPDGGDLIAVDFERGDQADLASDGDDHPAVPVDGGRSDGQPARP